MEAGPARGLHTLSLWPDYCGRLSCIMVLWLWGCEAGRSKKMSPQDSRNSGLSAEMCSGAGLWKGQAERKLEPLRKCRLLQGQGLLVTSGPLRVQPCPHYSLPQAMAARILEPAGSRALRAELLPPGLSVGWQWDHGGSSWDEWAQAGSVPGCPERLGLDVSSICSLPGLARA